MKPMGMMDDDMDDKKSMKGMKGGMGKPEGAKMAASGGSHTMGGKGAMYDEKGGMHERGSMGGPGMSGDFVKKNSKDADFAKGGDTPMFGKGDRTVTDAKDAAGTATPGETYKDPTDSGGKFAMGGSTKMFGYQGSLPAMGGQTSAR